MKRGLHRIGRVVGYASLIFVLMIVVMVTPLLVSDLISQGRIDRVFYNELCRGIFTLTDAAKFKLGTTDGGGSGAIVINVRNLSGVGVGAGRAFAWRSTPLTCVSTVGSVAGATATIADDLITHKASSETLGAKYVLASVITGTAATGDTVVVVGWNANGAAQTKRQALTVGASTTTMFVTGTGKGATKLYWTKVTSASMTLVAGTHTASLVAYPVGGVTVAAGLSVGDFAGVSVDSMASNAQGKLCIVGPVDVRVNAATSVAIPGTKLRPAGWGVLVTSPGAVDSSITATSMEYASQDSLLIRVKLGRQ